MNVLMTLIALATPAADATPDAPSPVAAEVLALERARARAPADPALREQLGALARSHDLARPDESLPYELTAVLDANGWTMIGLVSLAVFLGWLGYWAFGATNRRTLGAVPILATVVAAAGATGALVQRSALDRAVVMTSDAAGRLSPVPSAPIVFAARAGDVVGIGQRRGAWHRIATADGRVGWMRDVDLGRITGAE